MKNNKDYPARGLLYFTISFIILLTAGYAIFTSVGFRPYLKYSIGEEFVGYYKTCEEYEKIYNSIKKEEIIDGAKRTKYLTNEPKYEFVLVNENVVQTSENCTLIEKTMKKDFTIYKISINDEDFIYYKTEEEAEKAKKKITKEVAKNTQIRIEKIVVDDLMLITGEEKANEQVDKAIKTYRGPISSRGVSRKNKEYIWPTTSVTITSYFGNRSLGWHRGIDIGVKTNSPIYAMKDGTVILAGWNGSYGYQVQIKHSNSVITTYAHNSKVLVKKGDKVVQGQTIARSGSTGNSTGPHTHIEFIINGQFKNPLNYI